MPDHLGGLLTRWPWWHRQRPRAPRPAANPRLFALETANEISAKIYRRWPLEFKARRFSVVRWHPWSAPGPSSSGLSVSCFSKQPLHSIHEPLPKIDCRLHLFHRGFSLKRILISMSDASYPVKKHGPLLLKSSPLYVPLQVHANTIVALLAHSIPEENCTGGMEDHQVSGGEGGSISF